MPSAAPAVKNKKFVAFVYDRHLFNNGVLNGTSNGRGVEPTVEEGRRQKKRTNKKINET